MLLDAGGGGAHVGNRGRPENQDKGTQQSADKKYLAIFGIKTEYS